MARLRALSSRAPFGKLERRARGPLLAPSTLTIRRPRRRGSHAKRGVSIEVIRTNYRARDDGPGATGIDFPPLLRFIYFFLLPVGDPAPSSSPSASHPLLRSYIL